MAPSKTLDHVALDAIIGGQRNVIARRQALSCGMTRRALERRVSAGGPWRRLLPGVYQAAAGEPDEAQKELAALLYAGPRSVLTGSAALRRHGIKAPGTGMIDVLVPADRQRQSSGFVRINYTTRMPRWVCGDRGLMSFTQPDRAVAHAVRHLTALRDARVVVAAAVQGGRCSIGSLRRELRGGPMQRSALLRQALAEVADGIRSTAEGDLYDLIKWARLPVPILNPCLYLGAEFLAMPDCWWPEAGVAGEADSREWHLLPEDWQRTMQRHARMTASGILVLHFTPSQIRNSPAEVAAVIGDALRAGSARPRLPIEARAAAA